jgi:bifunctional non-homologous end joining protein LigD
MEFPLFLGMRSGTNQKNPLAGAATGIAGKDKGKASAPDVNTYLQQAEKTKFPTTLKPMLATLVDKPFDKDDWLYELKWDGYRALAFMNEGNVELKSRNDKSFNEKFYPVYDAVKKWGINAVVDGEIAVVNEQGMPNFGLLQEWRSEADGELVYFVFDILWLNGHDLTQLPLTARREILKANMPAESNIRMSQAFETSGFDFYDTVQKMGMEGIMAKKKDSIYKPGDRSTQWLKIKTNRRQEVVIGGYTINEGSSKPFSSLLVGVYNKGKLEYIGKIGTGFNNKTQLEILQQCAPLVIDRSPFTITPDINKPSRFRPNPPQAVATWVKPKLVCEVSFAEITSDGVMRHPSFEGMRMDKSAGDVKEEKELPVDAVVAEQNNLINSNMITPTKKTRRTLLNPKEETQVKTVNGHVMKFGNLSKVFWPDDNITKRDMLNYYYQVAPYMLPYLKDRPHTLNRHPQGIKGLSFYQKDITGKAPGWVESFLYHSEADERDKHFLVCTNEASLLYMASLGCIEINPWSSRVEAPDNPDWCIIDLDPDKSNSFEQVIQAARVTKAILDDMKVPSYCKTSGSTGLHIYIPLGAKYSYEQSKEFARVIATLVHKEIPTFTSIERKTADRGGKMYVDFLQNRPQATVAAPYSLRPKPGATVSMPLHWEEVKPGLKMKDFTIFNAMDRIRNEGDLFKPVLGKGIDMQKVISSWQKK